MDPRADPPQPPSAPPASAPVAPAPWGGPPPAEQAPWGAPGAGEQAPWGAPPRAEHAPWAPQATAPMHEGGRPLTVAAGLLAILGGAFSVAGTLFPVTTWGDDSQPPFAIFPILGGSASNAFNEFTWFALEPIGIAVVAGILGLALIVIGAPRRSGGGALLAFGLTTLLAFSAYVLSSVFTESFGQPYGPTPGPGSFLGISSGLLLLLAGMLALIAASARRAQ